MDQSFHFKTKILKGNGFGYIVFPGETYQAADSIRVKVTINSTYAEVREAARTANGFEFLFNQDQLRVMDVKYGQEVDVDVVRYDAPPQLNDLPADMLSSLQASGIAENFKRLPPDEQKSLLEEVMNTHTQGDRAQVINRITQYLITEDANMPRGESL
jgi:hypothetical protein